MKELEFTADFLCDPGTRFALIVQFASLSALPVEVFVGPLSDALAMLGSSPGLQLVLLIVVFGNASCYRYLLLRVEVQPSVVGKYRFLKPFAHGAMGTVYLAEDPILGRQVAIEFMAQGGVEDEICFLQEARVVASLVHPHIVVLLDFGFHKGAPYLVMEYLPGLRLDKWITQPRTLPEIARVMRGICLGLRHAHEHGVLHRDVKPSNIIVLPDGEAKLIDFGVARAPESKLTASGLVIGTPQYLAPEIFSNGEYSPKSDLYSLGVVFYEPLVKENPFQANNLAACLNKILTYNPPRARTPRCL